MINIYQQTLQRAITFNGYGIHTGKFSEITLVPLDADQGIIFRSENSAKKYITENVSGDDRGTQVLLDNGIKIQTVEHIVSALAGLGIDNVLIDVEGPEIPGKNGSAEFFVQKILEAGIKKQKPEKKFFKLPEKISLIAETKAILAIPAETFQVTFLIDYPDKIVKTDICKFDLNKDNYQKDLCKARTYGFQSEVESLWQKGLALGANLDNALVISEKGYSKPLNYPDELARHKIVDFIGDIMALGRLPLAEFFVVRSGHSFNQRFVRELFTKTSK